MQNSTWLSPVRDPTLDCVTFHDGVVYAHRDTGPLRLDLLVPTGTGPWPVIVFIHGGGWRVGDRTLCPDLREHFCARGFAMASIDYRFSSQALFPAQLHDVRSAIRYLRGHARDLDLDPDRIALWGASAGGHLATLAGLTSTDAALPGESDADGDASVLAVAESYGPTTLVADEIPASVSLPGMSTPEDTPEGRLIGGAPADLPTQARDASPLYRVTAAAPPFQISHGTADLLVPDEHSRRLRAALADAGVEVELYLVDGYQHGFLNPHARQGEPDPPLFDNGRLAAEGSAPALVVRGYGDTAIETPTRFGFDDVGDFFARHLLPTPATTPSLEGEHR